MHGKVSLSGRYFWNVSCFVPSHPNWEGFIESHLSMFSKHFWKSWNFCRCRLFPNKLKYFFLSTPLTLLVDIFILLLFLFLSITINICLRCSLNTLQSRYEEIFQPFSKRYFKSFFLHKEKLSKIFYPLEWNFI